MKVTQSNESGQTKKSFCRINHRYIQSSRFQIFNFHNKHISWWFEVTQIHNTWHQFHLLRATTVTANTRVGYISYGNSVCLRWHDQVPNQAQLRYRLQVFTIFLTLFKIFELYEYFLHCLHFCFNMHFECLQAVAIYRNKMAYEFHYHLHCCVHLLQHHSSKVC